MTKEKFQVGTGITSILMIFVVLCLTTFGVLAYETALNDKKMAEKRSDSITAMYKSTTKIEKAIMDVDEVLTKAKANTDNNDTYLASVNSDIENLSKAGQEVNITIEEGIISIVADIDDVRAYEVKLNICDINDEDTYEITKYAIINTTQWEGDEFEEFQGFENFG